MKGETWLWVSAQCAAHVLGVPVAKVNAWCRGIRRQRGTYRPFFRAVKRFRLQNRKPGERCRWWIPIEDVRDMKRRMKPDA